MADVKWTSVDKFTASYNTGTDPSLFYGRYDPVTGAYVGGQFFTPRISTGRSNTVRIKNGGLSVDANGTMYLCGVSASGLPLSFDPTGGYSGEAYVLIVKNDFSERLLCGKVGPGSAHSVSVAANGSGAQKVLWCGTARATSGGSLYLRNAPQPDLAGGEDGFFAYIPDSDGETSNTPPVAAFTAGQESGTTLRFDASASRDADGDALSFIWSFNDSDSWSEGRVARHTYPNPIEKTYRMMLTVRDSRGGWDQKELLFGPPRAGFSLSTRAGAAPLEVRFDAGRTTDPNDSLGSLLFDWYLKGSERQRGQAVSRTFTEPGLYKPLLEVRDNMAGYDSHSEYLLVASDESRAFRFDFGTDRNVEKDFTLVGKELYSSQRGYGWARMTDDVKAASWSHDDKIVTDGVQLQKYVKGERFDGEFMVDLSNGVYTVVMHFMQKYDYGFDGVEVEGEKKVAKVYAEGVADGPGLPQVDAFTVEVKDKQMNFVFRRPSGGYAVWFVSGIQIVPGAYDEQAVRSLPMPEIGTSLSRRYVSVRVFDLSGRVIRHSPRLPTATVRTENAVRLFPGLPCGMHVLRWYNESGGCIGSRPFVVTR
jgi:PKD repeat protein